MRLAIISDIHANLEALVKAFSVIDQNQIDEIICLGDVVGYGANPNECFELVQKRCSTILLGNHDQAAIDFSEASDFTIHARLAIEWTSRVLSQEYKDLIEKLPLTTVIEDYLFVHASPFEPEKWHYIISDADAEFAFDFFTQRHCFVGHSHVAGVFSEDRPDRENKDGPRTVINVGSIGQPRDGNPKLSFGILESSEGRYKNVRADYNKIVTAEKIVRAGLPRVLGERLMRGI